MANRFSNGKLIVIALVYERYDRIALEINGGPGKIFIHNKA